MPRRYATEEEALEARKQAQRAATKRYLASERGKAKRAEINARYVRSEHGKLARESSRIRAKSKKIPTGNIVPEESLVM